MIFKQSRGKAVAATVVFAAAVAFAPAASAAFTPSLIAATTTSGVATVDFQQPREDDAPALLAINAPVGSLRLGTPVGTILGSAMSAGVASDIGGSVVRLAGNVAVASASTPITGGGAPTAGAAAAACVGSAPDEIWVATMRGFAETVQLPIAVQRVSSGPLAGGYVLSVCPPPGNVAPGTPGRAVLGMKLIRLKLSVGHVFTNSAGKRVWHLRALPYAANSASANAAGGVQAEAHDALPKSLTLSATRLGGAKRYQLSGRLTRAGSGLGGASILIRVGSRYVQTKTTPTGSFTRTVRLATLPVAAKATVAVPTVASPNCQQPLLALPCVSSTFSGFVADSRAVLLRR